MTFATYQPLLDTLVFSLNAILTRYQKLKSGFVNDYVVTIKSVPSSTAVNNH